MSTVPGALRGELNMVGVFDMCELLRLNRMTGPLVLSHEDRRGMLLFQDGTIVNAVDDRNQEGEEAAYRLFTWRVGSFEFRREPIATSRLITESTEALMLEGARRLDESGEPGASDRLREHHGRFAALRDAFRSLSRDAHGEPRAAGESTLTQLDALRDADDRLVLRALAPPRLRSQGRWASASTEALPPDAFARLRAELLGPPELRSRRLDLLDGRALWVHAIGEGTEEALWFRPIELAPPSPDDVSGPTERLIDHVLPTGATLIVAGRTAENAEWLLHAVLELVGEAAPLTRLVVTPCSCYRRAEGPGVTLDVAPRLAAAAIEAVGPDLVALDAAVPLAWELVSALARVPRLVLGAIASDPPAALARVQAALELSGGGGLLEGTRVAIACEEAGDGRLGFSLNALPGPSGGSVAVRSGGGSARARAPLP